MLSEAYEYFGCNTADVFVISVNRGENNATCIQFDETYGIKFPCLSGIQGGGTAINNTYGIAAYPTYILIAPDHTIVEQDMWPIASVQTFKNYFQAHGIQPAPCSSTLTAGFTASDYSVCEGNQVQFTDASVGNPTSWSWVFEGGTPATSTQQNPVVTYSTSGLWDVSLTVSNGATNNNTQSPDIIAVNVPPTAFAGSDGETCVNQAYEISGASAQNALMVNWQVTNGNGTLQNSTSLNPTYIPSDMDAGNTVVLTLVAHGSGGCSNEISNSAMNLAILALPEVTLQNLGMACLEWPAFELTGGLPAGGTYSGTGVANGWFDPAVAAIGNHIISYTYTDAFGCTSFAEAPIEVSSCVGISENENHFYAVYPNPTSGEVNIDPKQSGDCTVQVINSSGKTVLTCEIQKSSTISLYGFRNGIYFMKISNNQGSFSTKLLLQQE